MSLAESSPSNAAHYTEAVEAHGSDIARFVAGYERDGRKRRELLQDVHPALRQSLAGYRSQCSLRTWVYRVAHNACVTHIQRSRRLANQPFTELEALTGVIDEQADISLVDRELDSSLAMAVIHSLKPVDRQVMLLYLEDLDAAAIGEVTGLSARNVATKVHRLKDLLATRLEVRRTTP